MSGASAAVREPSAHAAGGFWSTHVFSTDHKTIGKQYLALGALWAVVGGLVGLLAAFGAGQLGRAARGEGV